MIKKYGGQKVPKGPYWRKKRWEVYLVGTDGEVLPGGPDEVYLRMNVLEAIVFSAFLGGSLVLFLPFVGIVMVAAALGIAILTFLIQKVLCVIIRKICQAEAWVCDLIQRYGCAKCGKECDDHITMVVRAILFALIFLFGVLAEKYLFH
jgi:hypothetical protein